MILLNHDCMCWVQLACAMVDGLIFIDIGGAGRELVHDSKQMMMIV